MDVFCEIPADSGALTSLGLCRALSNPPLCSTPNNMNKNFLLRLSIALLAAVLMHVAPSDARAQAGPATFTEIQPLVYGLIDPGAAGGTLTVSDTGSVSVTGTVTYLGTTASQPGAVG